MASDSAASAAVSTRQKIVDYCEWAMDHADSIHYAQVRPIPHAKLRALPLTTDCSGFATMAYQSAGAPDPNGLGYNGRGYTGTLLNHGEKIAWWDGRLVIKRQPKPGDLIIFGDPPGRHVTVFLKVWRGAWLTCSHGQEIGPVQILNARERLAQRRGFQVRSYLP